MDIASLHGVCCQCISDNDCNSWVDVVLIFDESPAAELSSGVVTCSWWDNGGGIISIRGEGGEWFIGDKGVVKAASLSSWRSESFPAPSRKALSSLLCWTTLVDVSASGGVMGFISDSAWWWRLSEDSGRDLGTRRAVDRVFDVYVRFHKEFWFSKEFGGKTGIFGLRTCWTKQDWQTLSILLG